MSCKDFHIDLDRTAHNWKKKKKSMWTVIRTWPYCNFLTGGSHVSVTSVLTICFCIWGSMMKHRHLKSVQLLCDSPPVENNGNKQQYIFKAAELGQSWAPLKPLLNQ